MKKYFKNFGQSLKWNLLNWEDLLFTLLIGILILGINIMTGGLALPLALKIIIPYAIEIHVVLSIGYALFGQKTTKWSVK